MERAGSEDTDPDAERKGLGTPATRAAVIEKLVKGGFVERKGKAATSHKRRYQPCVRPAEHLDKPAAYRRIGKQSTQIAKGKADPAAFMEGIEDMARELVKTYPFLSYEYKRRCSSRNGKHWKAAPAAVLLSMRARRITIAATRNVSLPCGKMTVSLKNEK